MAKDKEPLGFGKYTFNSPEDISDKDPQYIIWLYEKHTSGKDIVSRDLYNSCVMAVEEQDHTDDYASIY